jgi:hypothetical protein
MSVVLPEQVIVCPKCGAESGDDWSQCERSCPMPMSPHYKKSTADRWKKPKTAKRKQSLSQQILAVKKKLQANRDELRELLEDAQEILDSSDDALNSLEYVVDRLSEHM